MATYVDLLLLLVGQNLESKAEPNKEPNAEPKAGSNVELNAEHKAQPTLSPTQSTKQSPKLSPNQLTVWYAVCLWYAGVLERHVQLEVYVRGMQCT
jgi:hypothetical protein